MSKYQVVILDAENELKNYIFLLKNQQNKTAIVIDPTRSDLVQAYCEEHDLTIEQIWITHKHDDHIAGLAELKSLSQADVFAPKAEQDSIKIADIWLEDGNHFSWEALDIEVIATAGHTLGHICFYIKEIDTLFSGDTLFVMGCGRIFEGTFEQMYTSLHRLARLPEITQVFCSHEYTTANADFAIYLMPNNPHIQQRHQQISALRQAGQPTVPTTIGLEKQSNVFLLAKDLTEFRDFRLQKDQF